MKNAYICFKETITIRYEKNSYQCISRLLFITYMRYITKSYYVSVTSVEPVIKTIKRYDTPNVQTCREGNKLIECDSEFQKLFELSDMTYHLK